MPRSGTAASQCRRLLQASPAGRALDSKPAAHRCHGRSMEQTGGRADRRTLDSFIDHAPHTMRAVSVTCPVAPSSRPSFSRKTHIDSHCCRLSPREYRQLCVPAARRRATFVDRLVLRASELVHRRLCTHDRFGECTIPAYSTPVYFLRGPRILKRCLVSLSVCLSACLSQRQRARQQQAAKPCSGGRCASLAARDTGAA